MLYCILCLILFCGHVYVVDNVASILPALRGCERIF